MVLIWMVPGTELKEALGEPGLLGVGVSSTRLTAEQLQDHLGLLVGLC